MTLQQTLEKVESMSIEDQQELLNILQRRVSERRRESILANYEKSKEEGLSFSSELDYLKNSIDN